MRKKQEQEEKAAAYQQALETIHKMVKEDKGGDIREEMREDSREERR